jgi:hypothetical protein
VSPLVSSLLTATLVAAGAGSGPGDLAVATSSSSSSSSAATRGSPIPPELGELLEQALPPPPQSVVLTTSYYGTVTVNHAAHLSRKARCKDCHGPGPVRSIEFTPKIAHERCVGCHEQRKSGPVGCKGCHSVAAQPATAAAPGTVPLGSPGENAEGGAGPGAASAPPPPEVPSATAHAYAFGPVDPSPQSIERDLQFSGLAGSGVGLSVRVSSTQAGFVFTQAVERLASGSQPRTTVTLGAGAPIRFPLARTLRLVTEGQVGLDVVDLPVVRVFPVVGVRAGLEWRPRWFGWYPLLFAISGFHDLFHDGSSPPAYAFATFGVGVPLTSN